MFIKEITSLFVKHDIPFAIVGGYAVALHGIVRGTFDVDLVTELSESNFVKIENALKSIGMKPLLPVNAADLYRNLAVYIKEKNLIAWNFVHPTRLRDSLDIIITEDLRNLQTEQITSDLGRIPVLSLDSLIQMKAKANREQDLKDIEALKALKRDRK